MHGSVEESTTGSTIHAQFKRGPQSLMLLLGFGVLCPLVFSIVPSILWIYQLKGRYVFLITDIICDLVGILAVIYVIVGARNQAKFTRECLGEMVAGMKEDKQEASAN